MGGNLSNMFDFKSQKTAEDVAEANLRRYQEEMNAADVDENLIAEDSDKKEVKWWQHVLFDKRVRIGYVFVLGVILGIVIPSVIFATKLDNSEKSIYGSCLIKKYARFECLVNSAQLVTEKMCQDALCCWENSADADFKCYHSLPTAYEYNILTSNRIASDVDSRSDGITLELKPNRTCADNMSNLRVSTTWKSGEHLVLEITNSDIFSKVVRNESSETNVTDVDQPFDVSWAQDKDLFYLRIARRESKETIFDTRLGPVYATGNDITLTTLLPTKYFYGLKGGQGSAKTETYGIVNGFENSEFPFYTAFEASGHWHGVYVDTIEPILVQVLQAPGLMFYMQTDRPQITLNFFSGPTQEKIMKQLHNFISEKYDMKSPPMIPEYWGLGLHICRRLENISMVQDDIDLLLDENKGLIYESDCIDEYLRHPVSIDETRFNHENFTAILKLLDANNKKILLSQKSSVAFDDKAYLEKVLVISSTNRQPFEGSVDNVTVNYIDSFHDALPDIKLLSEPFTTTTPNTTKNETQIHGFSLDDSFPLSYKPHSECNFESSRLKSYFSKKLTSSSDIEKKAIWSNLCPDLATHSVADRDVSHMRLHNQYGEQYLKFMHKAYAESVSNTSSPLFLTSGSFWTTSRYFGGYNGMQVPFTWQGLQESVRNIVRNYAMAPISGTPICGGIMLNNVTIPKDNDLCLRWYQFGLLLPLARNSYNGNSSYGPAHLPEQYRKHLNQAIKTRYAYAPYYYTELTKYQETFVPIIRPMSFDFSDEVDRTFTLPVTDQFMVGSGILAAPIIDRGVTRNVYFPAGTWYAIDGQEVWSNHSSGAYRQVSGFITETPMFLRGGHTIPMIRNPQAGSIQGTLKRNYTLLVGFSTTTNGSSNGGLTVKEVVEGTVYFHKVNFQATLSVSDEFANITLAVSGQCPTNASLISKTIDQVHFLGILPPNPDQVAVTSNGNVTGSCTCDTDEKFLEIVDLDMNWCTNSEYYVKINVKKL